MEQLFDELCGQRNAAAMTEDCLPDFFARLSIALDDPVALALIWQWGCARQNAITRQEFCAGMGKFACRTLAELQACLGRLRAEMEVYSVFREFHRWCFRFLASRQLRDRKTLGLGQACNLLVAVLRRRYPAHVQNFAAFLDSLARVKPQYRVRSYCSATILVLVHELIHCCRPIE